jgi:isoleucyl-tRNA synthetase
MTPELEAEGLARDLIRTIQQARKDADLEVTERVEVEVAWSPENLDAIQRHEPAITAAVLASKIFWLVGTEEPRVKLTTL